MEQLQERLLARAFCYDDPDSYRAGVVAALRMVRRWRQLGGEEENAGGGGSQEAVQAEEPAGVA